MGTSVACKPQRINRQLLSQSWSNTAMQLNIWVYTRPRADELANQFFFLCVILNAPDCRMRHELPESAQCSQTAFVGALGMCPCCRQLPMALVAVVVF